MKSQSFIGVIVVILVFGTIGIGGVLWVVWNFMLTLEAVHLAIWALLATLSLPVCFAAGFYLGKVEAKGFLGGVDVALEKLAKAVDLRDKSTISIHKTTKEPASQPPKVIVLPQGNVPHITHRATTDDEVIDL